MEKESPKGLSFRNIIQYAGLTSEEYAVIKKDFYGSNWMILNVTLILSFFVLLAYAAVSIRQGSETDICISYSIACICCLIAGIVNIRNGKNNERFLAGLTDIFISLLWIMGIYNGTIGDPDRITMTFIVLIMVLPLVFNVRPGPMIAKLFCACIVFIIFVLKFKNPQVAGTDISDAVAFTASSMVLTTYLNCAKAKGILARNQFKSAAIQDKRQLEEILALNGQLEENQAQMEKSASEQEAQIAEISALNSQLQDSQAEQEAQMEEIAALNTQLQENQARLEEASAEQETQLEETQALNQELQESRDRISEAYGMVEGLSSEYHTIWLVNKETLRMRLVRSNGISTANGAVRMAEKVVELDPTVKIYVENYVMPEDQERALREMSSHEVLRHLNENKYGIYAVNYLRKDDSGRISYHQIAFANADTEDGKKQFVLGFRDVDKIVKEEQKQKEELKAAKEAADAANKAKTSFLFNMSHDIRTPMNAIIGFTDLIEKHYDDREKCMDYIHKTQEANKLLLSLINNVLEMARIESGKEQLDETVCQTGIVTHEILSIFEDKIREKNISITSNVAIQTPYMLCDQPKLREICLNILSNAVKYTPEGGSIHVEMLELPCERPGYATIRGVCSDTGIGMSKDFLPHLFEEFTREQTTTESRQQGTGLGMPIVKKLVDLMGGTIEVESELGKGTTFTVTIDLKIVGAAPDAKPENNEETDQMDFAGKRILLAEDNDLNAEIAIEILSEVGFEVERAADGIICVDMLQKSECGYYDLILMDVQMPNMDGYQATRMIRSMNDPNRSRIPIIAMTANAFDQDKKNAIAAGMNGHLAKPIVIPKLMEILASILK